LFIVAAHHVMAGQEAVMPTLGLVIFTFIGVALYAGLSMTLFIQACRVSPWHVQPAYG
jgi:hypothetical protein